MRPVKALPRLTRFFWAVYVGYISLQIPSNMLIQYTGRPSIFIPACVFVWGGISTSTGAVKSFGPALVVSTFCGWAKECSWERKR